MTLGTQIDWRNKILRLLISFDLRKAKRVTKQIKIAELNGTPIDSETEAFWYLLEQKIQEAERPSWLC